MMRIHIALPFGPSMHSAESRMAILKRQNYGHAWFCSIQSWRVRKRPKRLFLSRHRFICCSSMASSLSKSDNKRMLLGWSEVILESNSIINCCSSTGMRMFFMAKTKI